MSEPHPLSDAEFLALHDRLRASVASGIEGLGGAPAAIAIASILYDLATDMLLLIGAEAQAAGFFYRRADELAARNPTP